MVERSQNKSVPGQDGHRTVRATASWLLRWTTTGGLAVLDQALLAGGHVLLSVLLARWLSPAEYGEFAVAYAIFVLVSSVHGALLLQPMTVFASGKYLPIRRHYLHFVLHGHVALTVVSGLVVIGLSMSFGSLYSVSLSGTLVVLGVSLPFMLLTWVTRRAFYVDLRPGTALAGTACYAAILLAGSWWLFNAARLSPVTAFLAMAFAGAMAGAAQLPRLRLRWQRDTARVPGPVQLVREHWRYGRWMLGSATAMWLPMNIYYLVGPASFGLDGAGALKALLNLANPVLHSLIALGVLLTPVLVRQRARGEFDRIGQTIVRSLSLFAFISVAYLLILWFMRVELLRFLYGGKYLEYSGMPMLLTGLLPVSSAVMVPLGATLLALERPDHVFWCYVASGVVGVAAGLLLVSVAGLSGALLGMLLSSITATAAMSWFVWRNLKALSSCSS